MFFLKAQPSLGLPRKRRACRNFAQRPCLCGEMGLFSVVILMFPPENVPGRGLLVSLLL